VAKPPYVFQGDDNQDVSSVRYGAGRGGFLLARPRPYTGPGGYFSGNPRPAPVRGPPALIPWTGPRLLPPIFDGDGATFVTTYFWRGPVWGMGGAGAWAGTGAGNAEKDNPPQAVEWGGAGKRAGARVLRGPVRPVTNSRCEKLANGWWRLFWSKPLPMR